ncbi:MAG: hypothetical protein MUC83_01630 [Pirellula sp.]|jgi:hypothetical protein|nr:hypothetical protein [Pirellula sp.]
MLLDAPIIAHGELFRLLGSLIGGLALIVVAIVNGMVAIPVGTLIGFATFRASRKRFRVAVGMFATLTTFVVLWIAEFLFLINYIDISKT